MATTASIHAHAAPQGFIRKYIFSLDHKVIGLQYYFLALTAVFVGMFLSLLMRIHLIWPAVSLPLVGDIKPETYLSLLTMHGTIMVFFVLTTAPQGGFGNYFLPIQIGAPDMAFPVLNMLSFWTTFIAFVILIAAFFVTGGAPLHGWTGYAPLSALPNSGPGEQLGADLWVTSIALFCVASLMGALNFITTTLDLRAKGMTLMRMPLTVWSWFITAILDCLVVVHHRYSRAAGVRRASLRGNSAVARPQSWDEFLRAAGGGERPDDGTQRRIATALATPVLVLRAP